MNEWERTTKRTDEKHKYSCIVPSHLFTFDCLLLKCERLWKFPLLLHHIHRPPPSTEIILRNLMLSFIRLPNHSVENVCKYPFSICFIHACSLCLFARFNSVWQFWYSFACPSLSVDHHFVYDAKCETKSEIYWPIFFLYLFLPIDHVRNIILVSTRYFRLQLVFIYLLLYFMPSSSIPLPHLSPFPYSETIFTISQAIMFGFICLAWKTCTKLDLSPSREFSFYQAISFIPQNIVHGVEWIFRYLKKLWQNWGQQNVENLQHPWHRNPFSVIIEYLCKSESQLRLYCQTLHLQWKY